MSVTALVFIWLAIAGVGFAGGLAGIAATKRRLDSSGHGVETAVGRSTHLSTVS